jgi:hypothetical protein
MNPQESMVPRSGFENGVSLAELAVNVFKAGEKSWNGTGADRRVVCDLNVVRYRCQVIVIVQCLERPATWPHGVEYERETDLTDRRMTRSGRNPCSFLVLISGMSSIAQRCWPSWGLVVAAIPVLQAFPTTATAVSA